MPSVDDERVDVVTGHGEVQSLQVISLPCLKEAVKSATFVAHKLQKEILLVDVRDMPDTAQYMMSVLPRDYRLLLKWPISRAEWLC